MAEPTIEEIMEALQGLGAQTQQASSLEQYREILPLLMKEGEIAVELFEEVVEKFGPKLVDYLEVIRKTVVQSRINTYKEYTGAGISEDNAVRLMIHDQNSLSQALQNLQNQKK